MVDIYATPGYVVRSLDPLNGCILELPADLYEGEFYNRIHILYRTGIDEQGRIYHFGHLGYRNFLNGYDPKVYRVYMKKGVEDLLWSNKPIPEGRVMHFRIGIRRDRDACRH